MKLNETHLEHIFTICDRCSFNFTDRAVSSIVVYHIDTAKHLFGFGECGLNIGDVLDVHFEREDTRSVFVHVCFHGIGFADGGDDTVSILEQIFSDSESDAVACTGNWREIDISIIIQRPSTSAITNLAKLGEP